jgi:hypothetical protein
MFNPCRFELSHVDYNLEHVIFMAKMTKAQARKRLKEAEKKLMDVAVNHPSALSFKTMDTIIGHLKRATKKLA